MSTLPKRIRALPIEERAIRALRAAVRKVHEENSRLGLPLYVWENGKVVARTPAQVRRTLHAAKKKAPRRARG
jgi:hypothetical protein